ncbi:MAG: hypothetical protein ACKVH8_10885 [Pirellulales bacterium]
MTDQEEINPFESPQGMDNDKRPASGSIKKLMIASVCLIVVSSILLLVYPGLGIFGFLITIPGMIYGTRKLHFKESIEGTLPLKKQHWYILTSFLLMIPVLLASSIAFAVFCIGTVMLTLTDIHRIDDTPGLIIGIPIGLIVYGLIFKKILPSRPNITINENQDNDVKNNRN